MFQEFLLLRQGLILDHLQIFSFECLRLFPSIQTENDTNLMKSVTVSLFPMFYLIVCLEEEEYISKQGVPPSSISPIQY